MFRRKEKQSLINARSYSLEQAEERVKELTFLKKHYKEMSEEQRETINKQEKVIKEQNEKLKEILKLSESNKYNNEKAILNIIKELAKTAINTSSKQNI